MNPLFRFRVELVVLVGVASACALPGGSKDKCDTSRDCLGGFVCTNGTCVTACVPQSKETFCAAQEKIGRCGAVSAADNCQTLRTEMCAPCAGDAGSPPGSDGGDANDGGTASDGGGTASDGGGTASDGGGTASDGGGTASDGGGTASDGGGTGSDGGGANDGGSSPDAGQAGRTVTIRDTIVLTDETNTVTSKSGFTAPVHVFTAADGGTWVEWPGTLIDGGYTVPSVPAGEYVAQVGTSYYVSTVDALDLGYSGTGRFDTVTVDAGTTTLNLSVAGLPAWNDNVPLESDNLNLDDLQFFSAGAQLYGYAEDFLADQAPDSHPWHQVPTNFVLDYGSLTGAQAPLVNASRGDSLWVTYMQRRTLTVSPGWYPQSDGGIALGNLPMECRASTLVAAPNNVTLHPGTNALSATFNSTTTRDVALDWRRDEWNARNAETHPSAPAPREEYLFVTASPSRHSTSADLLDCFNRYPFVVPDGLPDAGQAINVTKTLTVADPWPASWVREAYLTQIRYTQHTLPDGGLSPTATASDWARFELGAPIAPSLHAPQNLTVNGLSTQLETVVAGQPLRVAWQRHPSPAATNFRLTLVKRAGRTIVARVYTRGTSFTFPAGFMTAGETYYVRVAAELDASPEGYPNSLNESAHIEAISNTFVAQ